jgi:hypothetical protein
LSPWTFSRTGDNLAELPVEMNGADKLESFWQDYALEILESVVLEEDEGVGRVQQPHYLHVTTLFTVSIVLD